MVRKPILISAAALMFAVSAGAASALPFSSPRAETVQPNAPIVEQVHYRKVRKYRSHHPHVFYRRYHRPSFSFSLSFGGPVARHYPYYYPYRTYDPYYYGHPYYHRRSYYPYYHRW